jgi:hypothetical protein
MCHRRNARHGHRDCPGLGNTASIAIFVALAFVFGYPLTLRPILGASMSFAVGRAHAVKRFAYRD